jgi:hypothetical protein
VPEVYTQIRKIGFDHEIISLVPSDSRQIADGGPMPHRRALQPAQRSRIDILDQRCWVRATQTKVDFWGVSRHKRKSRGYWKNDDTPLIFESVSPDEGAITCQQGKIAASEIESEPTHPNENGADSRIFDKLGKIQLADILQYERQEGSDGRLAHSLLPVTLSALKIVQPLTL